MLPEYVAAALHAQPELFRAGFALWLAENPQVWQRFLAMAQQVRGHGRRVYSARTIVETMRWKTDVGEISGPWKLNNNWVPSMARLFNVIHGIDFFQERHGSSGAHGRHSNDHRAAHRRQGTMP